MVAAVLITCGSAGAVALAPLLPERAERIEFSEGEGLDSEVVAARVTGRMIQARDVYESGGQAANLVDRQLRDFVKEAMDLGAMGVYAIDVDPSPGSKLVAPALAVEMSDDVDQRTALLELCRDAGGRPCDEDIGQHYFMLGKRAD